MFVSARWKDPRLTLPEAERKGQMRFMSLDEIWTPRVLFINDRGLTDLPESQYFTIRDGVIVVPKNAVLGDGWRPALGSN